MERVLFKPLSMSRSTYTWTREVAASIATPHNTDGKAWPHYIAVEKASGGLYTTASDLARFVAATAPGKRSAGRGIITPATVREMVTPVPESAGRYGLGYKMFPVSKEMTLVSHDGANEGYRAMFLFDPKSANGIVILTNSDAGGRIVAPIVCVWSAFGGIDMSAMCKVDASL